MSAEWVDDVLQFWFQELAPQAWFRKDEHVDALVRERFEGLHKRLSGLAADKFGAPRTALAGVIVLDQFPRNMYRNSPLAYSSDSKALAIAEQAIDAGFDRLLSNHERVFLYMPFQHSESAAVQMRSLELFGALGDAQTLDYARQHKEIIDRFGRFPHRNAVLQRTSSPEESAFLRTHNGF